MIKRSLIARRLLLIALVLLCVGCTSPRHSLNRSGAETPAAEPAGEAEAESDSTKDHKHASSCPVRKSLTEELSSLASARARFRITLNGGEKLVRQTLIGQRTGLRTSRLTFSFTDLERMWPDTYTLLLATRECTHQGCIWGHGVWPDLIELSEKDTVDLEDSLEVDLASVSGRLVRGSDALGQEEVGLIKVRKSGAGFDPAKFQLTTDDEFEFKLFPGEYEIWAMAGVPVPRNCIDSDEPGNHCPPHITAHDDPEQEYEYLHAGNITVKAGEDLTMDLDVTPEEDPAQPAVLRVWARLPHGSSQPQLLDSGQFVFRKGDEVLHVHQKGQFPLPNGEWHGYFSPLPDLPAERVVNHVLTVDLGPIEVDQPLEEIEVPLDGHCQVTLETAYAPVPTEAWQYLRLTSPDGGAHGMLHGAREEVAVAPESGVYSVEFHWPSGATDSISTLSLP